MKKFILLLMLTSCAITFAQEQLNNYKYIIVPKQFDSFKQENQYQTSTLVKFILENKGFNVFYDDDLPSDLSANRCLGLLVSLVNNSSMFTTKTAIAFKDCNSKEIYSTKEGTSKIKEYKASYNEAIKDALSSLNSFNYNYNQEASKPITVSFKNDVKNVKPKPKTTVEEIATSTEVSKNQTTENSAVVDSKPKVVLEENSTVLSNIFYAQSIENGYQLVDSTPKIVMKMLATSKPNFYFGEDSNGNSGLVYSENGLWFFEYYVGSELMKNKLNIKF